MPTLVVGVGMLINTLQNVRYMDMKGTDYSPLERYVGKVFYMDFNEVEVLFLLGGECAPPFFLCKWRWSDMVYSASPLDVIPHFDDNFNPIKDVEIPE